MGDEVRLGLLVFAFGDGRDQIVVQGSAIYPAAGPTIAADSSTVRPVVGGSGRYLGAGGSAESTHLADGDWRHSLVLVLPRAIRGGRFGGTPFGRDASPAPSASPAAVVRTDLGTTLPDTAPGQRLGLWRVTIPAGASLPAHWHPGHQLARIETGTLTYTILTGELTILHPDGTTTTATAGQTVDIPAGTSVVEQPGAEHCGGQSRRCAHRDRARDAVRGWRGAGHPGRFPRTLDGRVSRPIGCSLTHTA